LFQGSDIAGLERVLGDWMSGEQPAGHLAIDSERLRGSAVRQSPGVHLLATFDTNVLGTILGMKHAMRVMRPQAKGSIVNLSSTMGHKGAPGASIYTASKHAVEGLTKAAALEGAGFGVRVNAVAPGPVETEMLNRFTGSEVRKAGLIAGVPMQHAGTPEDIAHAIVFFASDKAAFITGQILSVDGGKSAT
jgi:NAD(P)-dependent dehydrogenase (short-subunit alcohol dehydrogenase family)